MAGVTISVHVEYVPDWGPASNFVPPTMQVQEKADAGGGQPTVPNALTFVEPDSGETHVFLVSEKMRQALLRMLTGGVIVAGAGDVLGGGGGSPGGGGG